MASRLRRLAHPRARARAEAESVIEVPSDDLPTQVDENDAQDDEAMDDEEEQPADEEEEEEEEVEEEYQPFPPPGLKEISSLASWTVSTAKPGSGVAALRSPDTDLYWQSDGPQPHLLSIHFFKLVEIVHIRIFLDFANDESYTPTKIQFLAGMGAHDMHDFAEMSFEQPTGWIDVDFSNVGPIEAADDDDATDPDKEIDWSKRPALRAFLVQVRILENHQNGKDTHLRCVQLFARDETQETRRVKREPPKPTTKLSNLPTTAILPERNNIKKASWMLEPDLR